MYAEIHRHLVMYKKLSNSNKPLFRQIVVVERENYEVRVFESDVVQLDKNLILDGSSAEFQLYEDLVEAIENAENKYKQSVRQNWRAFDPNISRSLDPSLIHRTTAA